MTSPNEPDRAEVLGTAQVLADALNGVSERLDAVNQASEDRDAALNKYGRANRHRITLTYGLLAVDIALTVVVAIFAGQAHSAAEAASQNRQAEVSSCVSGNMLRDTLTEVFDHVFGTVRPPVTATAAQKAAEAAQLQALEAYYRAQFAPRNCTAIYGVTPAATAPAKATPTGKAG